MEEIKMDRIEDAIADFKEGKFVIVVDDEDRENEGDLIPTAFSVYQAFFSPFTVLAFGFSAFLYPFSAYKSKFLSSISLDMFPFSILILNTPYFVLAWRYMPFFLLSYTKQS